MITELTLIALSLSMGGQPALDAPAGEALLAQAPQAFTATAQDAQDDEKKAKRIKQTRKKAADQKDADKTGKRVRTDAERAANKKALEKRFDANGDGKLDAAEGKAMREHMAARRAEAGKAKGEKKGERKGAKKAGKKAERAGEKKGAGGAKKAEMRKALEKRFDADGDGTLSETERKAMTDHMAAERTKAARAKAAKKQTRGDKVGGGR